MLLSLAPFVAIMVTSFVKLVVVLSLVRNAMGVQQTPPNMVINGLAVILTVYIMAPVAQDAFDIIQGRKPDLKNIESVKESVIASMEPLKKFLVKHTHMKERKFFVETAKKLWPPERAATVTDEDFLVLVPALLCPSSCRPFRSGF